MTRLLAALDVFLATAFAIVAPHVALAVVAHALIYPYATVFPS